MFKDIVIGAVAQIIPKTISHLTFIIMRNQGVTDAELRANPWYMEPVVGLPPVDDWVTCLGIPLGLYGAGALMKKTMLKEMAKGAGIAGGATFIHLLVSGLPKTVLPPALPPTE